MHKTLVIDLPTLRLDWIENEMPRLAALAKGWHRGPIDPVFPALTCTSQATLTTGVGPEKHGIIANGLYDRATRLPEFWTFTDEKIEAKRIWEKARESGAKTGVFFFLNINGAKSDVIILPKPIHKPDGSMEMWCYHKPDGIYPELVKEMGHFNLLRFWGPMAGIESSKWIAESARKMILKHDLDLSFIYLPHTDYAPQKFGPESDPCRKAHRELDGVMCDLIEALMERWKELKIVIVSEYAITPVSRCLKPNLKLREAGLIAIERRDGREYLDYVRTPAIALADHQVCHIYCAKENAARIAEMFRGENCVEAVITDARECGLVHPNSGEVILVARPDAWFAYPWWEDFSVAPDFANKIDIHNKPGYDPLEMFWDVKINGTSQDATLVQGSHGAFPRAANQRAGVVSNLPGIESARSTAEVHGILAGRDQS
ncbi:alkaline phosphatase family protein [Candidatus Sumerlaeota bacterium]|nr:alkaline phosphatase family protein [Candidatus Sumerlaeota bacterium]